MARYYLARLQGISEVLQHQVVQVVGEELSLGPLHLVDGLLGPFALREVAGYLGETARCPPQLAQAWRSRWPRGAIRPFVCASACSRPGLHTALVAYSANVVEEEFSAVCTTEAVQRRPCRLHGPRYNAQYAATRERKCMDASSNTEMIKRYVEAFERKDWGAATAFWTDDVACHVQAEAPWRATSSASRLS